jgi:hypothetical protein
VPREQAPVRASGFGRSRFCPSDEPHLLPRNRFLRHCSDLPPLAPAFATTFGVLAARTRKRPFFSSSPCRQRADTDAGVVLVSPDQLDELNAALVRVSSDVAYRMDLATRSRATYQTHFTWPAIAARIAALLHTR